MDREQFLQLKIKEVIERYPFMESYFEEHSDRYVDINISVVETYENISEEEREDFAIDVEQSIEAYYTYVQQMFEFLGIKEEDKVRSLTLLPGTNKFKEPEQYEKLHIQQGEIVAIVGPTGSGKSRLLADIEWTADKDTPTSRSVLVNEKTPDKKWRFSSGNKLVAQLSQNMNFVMDLTVQEFLELHAASRMIEDIKGAIEKIIAAANALAGEAFDLDTPITSLSGGQSRALMIADTAILSESPIVLIDEIENAGIDRKKALKLLVKEEKIVLIATHDPILALMADRRIIIRHGGISDIIETTDEEKQMLVELEKLDSYMMEQRTLLRQGQRLKLN
ncbi:ATP-binding cassette domain-containing protein [Vallitaleaceae bacterium 9-2]